MRVIQRSKAPTPKFFKNLRAIGLALAAISGAILTLPFNVPDVCITVATYTGVAGAVMAALCHTAVKHESENKRE